MNLPLRVLPFLLLLGLPTLVQITPQQVDSLRKQTKLYLNRFALLLLLLLSAAVQAQHPPHPKLAQAQAEYRQAAARRDTLAMAEAAYLVGKRHRVSGDYVSSRRWVLHSLRIREPRGPSVQLNRVYVELTGGSVLVGNYREALSYAHRALANSRKLNHPHSLMSAYGVLSSLYHQLSIQRSVTPDQRKSSSATIAYADSALWYIQQAETIALRLNDPEEVAGIRQAKGVMLVEGKPQKAISLLRYALAVYNRKPEARHDQAKLHLALANAQTATGQLPAARQHLLAVETIFRQGKPIIDAHVSADMQYSWAGWCRASGQWERAYRHLRSADSLRQFALTTEQRTTIARLNTVYDTDRRENLLKIQTAELALRDTKLQVQEEYSYASSGLLGLATVVGFVLYRLNRQNKRISLQNVQLMQEQSHRMKNNLQTISGMLSLQSNRLADADAKRAVEESQLRVQTMALLSRKLYDTQQLATLGLPTVIPDLVQSILRSYGCGTVRPDYQLEPIPLHVDQAIPIALIINELVTNACKYAFPDHPDPILLVGCQREKDRMWLRVQDNGPGMLMTPDSTGFGLHLIAIQVRQLGGSYAFSNSPGVTFDLSIPTKQ